VGSNARLIGRYLALAARSGEQRFSSTMRSAAKRPRATPTPADRR